jgi:hypothetical protein
MDDFEIWFDKGVTDGLPVVPPTRERVERMLAGTRRDRAELAGDMPPNYGRATVERVAVNAVMAGCRPEYLPVVLAAVEAACDPAFALHGMSTSTHFSAPLIVINGPIRTRLEVNCSFGVFGPGYRANATIGRALRLAMINIGGAKPGETSMSTFGHPGRYTYCIGEFEEVSPWPALAVERGVEPGRSAVTLFAGEAPHGISDHASRTARALAGSIGWTMSGLWNIKHFPLYSHTMVVVGPEHARVFADDGWSKDDLKRHLHETVRVPYHTLLPGRRQWRRHQSPIRQGEGAVPGRPRVQISLGGRAACRGGGWDRRPLLDGHPGLARHQERIRAGNRGHRAGPLTG